MPTVVERLRNVGLKSQMRQVGHSIWETMLDGGSSAEQMKKRYRKLSREIQEKFGDRCLTISFGPCPFLGECDNVFQYPADSAFEDVGRLLVICKQMASWCSLEGGRQQNVVLIHGAPPEYMVLLLGCYLYFLAEGDEISPDGITFPQSLFKLYPPIGPMEQEDMPSVLRYLQWFADLVRRHHAVVHLLLADTGVDSAGVGFLPRVGIRLQSIILSRPPLDGMGTCPELRVVQRGEVLQTLVGKQQPDGTVVFESQGSFVADLIGDFALTCYYYSQRTSFDCVFRAALNSCFMESFEHTLSKRMLNRAHRDRRIPQDFSVTLRYLLPATGPTTGGAEERYCLFPSNVREQEDDYRRELGTLLDEGVRFIHRRGQSTFDPQNQLGGLLPAVALALRPARPRARNQGGASRSRTQEGRSGRGEHTSSMRGSRSKSTERPAVRFLLPEAEAEKESEEEEEVARPPPKNRNRPPSKTLSPSSKPTAPPPSKTLSPSSKPTAPPPSKTLS
eukprot:Hpha_TRINITY_DN16281_c0_g2::TRINITY_DN16281_c0_g2_i1::g.14808::m.14808